MRSADHTILALGASHLSLVELSRSPDGWVLEEVYHQCFVEELSQKDCWLDRVASAIGPLHFESRPKAVSALVLPGWAVLSKVMKVARIEGDGQCEVVRFEAEAAMPNGLEDHDWTFSTLGDDGFERDVWVQAVPSKFLESLLEMLSTHGIQPSRVDSTTFCQFQAFKKQYGEEKGASVILDVGSRSVSLIIHTQEGVPFIRSFVFGSNMVTQAVAEGLGKSFPDAERLKLEWVRNREDIGAREALTHYSEGFVARLLNEIQRSLALHRRQIRSGDPERILLSGGGSQLPGLAELLERTTGITSFFYDPFRGLSSGVGLAMHETTAIGYSLPPVVGMAFGSCLSDGGQSNLLPRPISLTLEYSGKRPWRLASAALLPMSVLLVGLNFHLRAWQIRGMAAALESDLGPLRSLAQSVNAAHEEHTRLSSRALMKVEMIKQRQQPVALFADLQERLNEVEDVWLESITPEASNADGAPGRLRVTGSLLDRENPLSQVSRRTRNRVEGLLESIEDSPFIQRVENRRFDTSRPGILRFDFSLVLQPERGL